MAAHQRWQRGDSSTTAMATAAQQPGRQRLARQRRLRGSDGISAAAAVAVALERQRSGGVEVRSGRYFFRHMFFLLW